MNRQLIRPHSTPFLKAYQNSWSLRSDSSQRWDQLFRYAFKNCFVFFNICIQPATSVGRSERNICPEIFLSWGLSGGKELKGIEILQKKAMRYIENTHSRAHTNVLFYKYKTLMVKDLIDYNICNFMQKCTHNTAPSSFQNLFIKNRNFDRSLSYNLKLVRKTSLRLFPTLVFPRVWNALTLESKRSESLALFKKKILSDNLEKYNVPCGIQSCKSCS